MATASAANVPAMLAGPEQSATSQCLCRKSQPHRTECQQAPQRRRSRKVRNHRRRKANRLQLRTQTTTKVRSCCPRMAAVKMGDRMRNRFVQFTHDFWEFSQFSSKRNSFYSIKFPQFQAEQSAADAAAPQAVLLPFWPAFLGTILALFLGFFRLPQVHPWE